MNVCAVDLFDCQRCADLECFFPATCPFPPLSESDVPRVRGAIAREEECPLATTLGDHSAQVPGQPRPLKFVTPPRVAVRASGRPLSCRKPRDNASREEGQVPRTSPGAQQRAWVARNRFVSPRGRNRGRRGTRSAGSRR